MRRQTRVPGSSSYHLLQHGIADLAQAPQFFVGHLLFRLLALRRLSPRVPIASIKQECVGSRAARWLAGGQLGTRADRARGGGGTAYKDQGIPSPTSHLIANTHIELHHEFRCCLRSHFALGRCSCPTGRYFDSRDPPSSYCQQVHCEWMHVFHPVNCARRQLEMDPRRRGLHQLLHW